MAHTNSLDVATEHIWYLDSGCSNHMCGKREFFFEFDNSFKDNVKMGNIHVSVYMVEGEFA
jgi:hypothetical protein